MSNRKLPPTEKGKGLVPSGGAGKTPTLKGTNFRANFEALIAPFDAQAKLWGELRSVWLNQNARVDLSREGETVAYAQALWKHTREGAEQILATMNAVFLLREVNLTSFELSASDYLFWRIVQLIKKTWHDVKMSEEEIADVAENMAERLALEEGISAQAWESIFCEIADTKKKLPLITEMLEFLKKTKHIAHWERRLASVNRDQIQRAGEETVFAFGFKNAVFKEAVLTYVDNHGYTDLAAMMRDEDDEASKRPWYGAIQATAKSEGLSALVTQMEADDGVSYDEARDILTKKKHVMIEWDLLLKNTQRRLNSDKAFACVGCGAGYDKKQYCKICGTFVVAHAEWEQHIEKKQAELEQQYKIECNLSRKQKLLEHYSDKHYEKGKSYSFDNDREWMAKHINLEKPILPPKRYLEILHWSPDRSYPYWNMIPEVKGSEDEWIWVDETKGIGYDGVYGTASAVLSFNNPLAYYETSNEFMSAGDEYDVTASGIHYLMTAVYENIEGRKLSLKTIIPYQYKVKQVMVGEKSISHEQIGGKDQVLTEAECKTLDHLLAIKEPTLDDQVRLAELVAKLYAAFLPPPLLIRNLRSAISERTKQGRPRDPYERLEYDLAEAEAVAQQKAEEEAEARDRAEYEQSPQGQLEAWLSSLALRYHLMVVENFKYHGIDETVLPHLTHESLKELGIEWVGDRIKLLNGIAIRFPAEQSPVTDGDVEMHVE